MNSTGSDAETNIVADLPTHILHEELTSICQTPECPGRVRFPVLTPLRRSVRIQHKRLKLNCPGSSNLIARVVLERLELE